MRDERFGLRKNVADQLSDALQPTIRVTITQAGNRDGYRALLTEALKGQSMKYTAVVDRIVQSASPEEFSILVQRTDAARLAERTGLDEERAKKVIEALRDNELLYRIETVELEDLPRVELKDGKEYKDSTSLSTGQRCTTILPILLLESERPLLIDQPEDNLDNAFIYQAVVKSLRGAKGKRRNRSGGGLSLRGRRGGDRSFGDPVEAVGRGPDTRPRRGPRDSDRGGW